MMLYFPVFLGVTWWGQNREQLVLGVMDMSTKSDNHVNKDCWGLWKVKSMGLLIQYEAE